MSTRNKEAATVTVGTMGDHWSDGIGDGRFICPRIVWSCMCFADLHVGKQCHRGSAEAETALHLPPQRLQRLNILSHVRGRPL